MKKLLFLFIFLFMLVPRVYADDLTTVSFVKCVDGDTAYFKIGGEEKKFRFLGVDTPETKHPTKGEEEGGKTASEFTCNSLKKAKKIQVEYDPKSDKVDKYDRELVWVYVDGEMLQEILIREGYAEVAYIYGDFQYVESLCNVQRSAIKNKQGIWYDGKREEGYCASKSNKKKTTKKTTTKKTSEADKFIELLEDGKYDKLLSEYGTTTISFIVVLGVIIIYILFKKRK